MPETKITYLPKSEVKIEFVVSLDEARPYIDEAVRDLSTSQPIPGFRPGKATYDDAKNSYGEIRILETALERIVRAFYVKTVLTENVDTVGSPEVAVDQLTPGQPIKFNVIAPIAPQVTALPDLKKCGVIVKPAVVEDKQIEDAIEEMRRMRRTEARVDRAATLDDLVIIDLEMMKDHVILEGGSGHDYRVFLNEQHYIPGLTKELEGIKEGEERKFTLKFPEQHFQKHLAGQPVDFTAKAKGVFELKTPEIDDAFAKGVGIDTIVELREKLKENMVLETKHKVDEAAEIEMLEKLVDDSAFTEVPDLLVNEEIRRMISELEHGVEEQGMKWQDYLSSIKKTPDELKLSFSPQAVRRIKTAILIKNLAKREKITVPEADLDAEADRILAGVKPGDMETKERVTSPEFREYMAIQMRNRKTLEWLKSECMK